MNKKLVSVVVSVATLTLLSGASFADFDPQFYVGGEAIANRLGIKVEDCSLITKTKIGGGVLLGTRFNENMGLEVGYGFLGTRNLKESDEDEDEDEFSALKLTMKTSNAYADVMGYLPVNCATDIIASVGVGYLNTKVKVTETETSEGVSVTESNKGHLHAFGPRVGVGAQYKFSDNIGARAMVNYQYAKEGVLEHLITAKLGVFYQF